MRDPHRRQRAFRRYAEAFLRHANFNLLNLPASGKITLVGAAMSAASLFAPWLRLNGGISVTATAFSSLAGYLGWIALPGLLVLAFGVIANRRKEEAKSRMAIPFYDHAAIIFCGVTLFLLALAVFNVSVGFSRTVGDAVRVDVQSSGLTFCLVGSALIVFGGILNYREKKRELLHMIYLENLASKESDLSSYAQLLKKDAEGRKNMSLPV